MNEYKYISLFSGGGIGDIGFRNAGYIPIVMNELEENRAEIIKNNYPDSDVIVGDIATHLEEIYEKALYVGSNTTLSRNVKEWYWIYKKGYKGGQKKKDRWKKLFV